jgi:cytochrome c oxidase cbb3-type subunit III
MSSPCRIEMLACTAILACAVLLTGCQRAASDSPPPVQPKQAAAVITSALVPGMAHGASTSDPRADAVYDNAQAVAEGKRLFNQYNCSGCHSNGGGGMGPALMDDEWIYGARLEQIHNTLVQGRPNGMPAWGGKIPDPQLWELAAYVRSMSLPETIDAANGPTPSQTPAPVPREVAQDPGWSPPPGTTNNFTDVIKGPGQ